LFFSSCSKIITIHSGSFITDFKKQSQFKKRIILYILKKSKTIIAVNKLQKIFLESAPILGQTNIEVIPAFISPQAENVDLEKNKIKNIPFGNKSIIVTSGFLFRLYGFEIVLDYLEQNQDSFGVFVFYSQSEPEYKSIILSRLQKLENAVYFSDISPEAFNWLLKKSDIYIRNTDRDGDCVAIREAAFWKTRVLASNVVNRPEGTVEFCFNNFNCLSIHSKACNS